MFGISIGVSCVRCSLEPLERAINGKKRIILTDEIYKLQETPFADNFALETESRWNLVETAWELNISRNLLNVRYDEESKIFFVDSNFNKNERS